MRRSKKIIVTVCVILCFSVAFMVAVQGYSATVETFYLHDNWVPNLDEGVLLGTIMQYNSSGSGNGFNIFSTSEDVYLLRDSYGVYGYNWNGFGKLLSGFTDHGTFSLTTTVPWTNFVPTEESPYQVSKIYLKYRMFGGRYTDSVGGYDTFNLRDAHATLKADGEVIQSFYISDVTNEGEPFVIDFEGSFVVTRSTNLSCEVTWKGKPSLSTNPFILFEWVRDGSYMEATQLDDYYSDINNQVKDDLNDIQSSLEFDEPDIGVIQDNLDIRVLGPSYLFVGNGEFYNFISSAAVIGVTLGAIGYILHGKKE